MSTQLFVSFLIRTKPKGDCYDEFIFTASHNPDGPNEDIGNKFNGNNCEDIQLFHKEKYSCFWSFKKIAKY